MSINITISKTLSISVFFMSDLLRSVLGFLGQGNGPPGQADARQSGKPVVSVGEVDDFGGSGGFHHERWSFNGNLKSVKWWF